MSTFYPPRLPVANRPHDNRSLPELSYACQPHSGKAIQHANCYKLNCTCFCHRIGIPHERPRAQS